MVLKLVQKPLLKVSKNLMKALKLRMKLMEKKRLLKQIMDLEMLVVHLIQKNMAWKKQYLNKMNKVLSKLINTAVQVKKIYMQLVISLKDYHLLIKLHMKEKRSEEHTS